MEFQQIAVNRRTASGKGANRKLRASGRIPGIIYGQGMDPLMIDIEPRILHKALQGAHRTNTVLNMKVGEEAGTEDILVMVQDWQIHPRDRHLVHVDFMKVDMDAEVQVDVPLETTGRCEGVQMGGILIQVFHRLPVRCKPADIPVAITMDITSLMIGDGLKAAELPVTEAVVVDLDPEQTILAVTAPEAEEEEKPEEELEEGEEGEEKPEGEAGEEGGEDRKPEEKKE